VGSGSLELPLWPTPFGILRDLPLVFLLAALNLGTRNRKNAIYQLREGVKFRRWLLFHFVLSVRQSLTATGQ
jgi:hypothetical protein